MLMTVIKCHLLHHRLRCRSYSSSSKDCRMSMAMGKDTIILSRTSIILMCHLRRLPPTQLRQPPSSLAPTFLLQPTRIHTPYTPPSCASNAKWVSSLYVFHSKRRVGKTQKSRSFASCEFQKEKWRGCAECTPKSWTETGTEMRGRDSGNYMVRRSVWKSAATMYLAYNRMCRVELRFTSANDGVKKQTYARGRSFNYVTLL